MLFFFLFVCFLQQDARDDVGGAQNSGMLGILVRTGELRNSQLLISSSAFSSTVVSLLEATFLATSSIIIFFSCC